MQKPLTIITTLILIVLIGYVALHLQKEFGIFNTSYIKTTVNHLKPSDTDQVRKVAPLPDYKKEIPVRPLVALSGASRDQVFNLRKEAVANSPFAQENYRPLDSVFGQIESGKPWYALSLCRGKKQAGTDGPSEETRFINNPTALVAIHPNIIFISDNKKWCTKENYNSIIQKITFDGPKREITVTYLDLPIEYSERMPYDLNGVNARDLGYPFIYIDMKHSTYKPSFRHKPNASTHVYEFRDFLHVGSSCEVEGGCNNGSPEQPEVQFDRDPRKSKMPREIYIKLWKEQPQSPQQTPDLVEKIIILPKGKTTNARYY